MKNEILVRTADCETVNSRVMNASVKALYEAWTNPKLLAQWWGPNGFTNTFKEFDLRKGGKWIFTMHGPDGKDYANESEFVEINENRHIIFNHISPPQFQIVATFEEVFAAQSRLTFKMVFDTAEQCNKLRDFVLEKNEENFDRLENVLKGHVNFIYNKHE